MQFLSFHPQLWFILYTIRAVTREIHMFSFHISHVERNTGLGHTYHFAGKWRNMELLRDEWTICSLSLPPKTSQQCLMMSSTVTSFSIAERRYSTAGLSRCNIRHINVLRKQHFGDSKNFKGKIHFKDLRKNSSKNGFNFYVYHQMRLETYLHVFHMEFYVWSVKLSLNKVKFKT